MKKVGIYKNNSCWLHSLIVGSIGAFILLVMSLVIFIVNMNYTIQKNNNVHEGKFSLEFEYDVIAYPVSFITSLLEMIFAIYLSFNIPSWIDSTKIAIGKRKKFNTIFIFSSVLLISMIVIDACIRLFYSFSYLEDYFKTNGENGVAPIAVIDFNKWGIFGSFSTSPERKYGNFGFNPVILVLVSFLLLSLFVSVFVLQKKLFKSEYHENSRDEVKNHYRNLEKNKMAKGFQKRKQKDFTKRIRTF